MLAHWPAQMRSLYRTHHPTIWLLTVGRLFNAIIQFMAMPFLTMYLGSQGVSLDVIGMVLSAGPLGSALGNLVGGQLADRLGRKPMMFIGMFISGLITAGFGFAHQTWEFALLFVLQGLFGSLGGPAWSAMITDLSPPEKRGAAFSLNRITMNVGTAVGPLLGALVIHRGLMFTITGVADVIFALVFLVFAVESLPESVKLQIREAKKSSKAQQRTATLREWWQVLTDKPLLLFVVAGTLSTIAYSQMFSTYPLYVQRFSGHPEQTFSWMLSLNGLMVVALQLPINHWIRKWSPGRQMVVGSLLYAASYALFSIPGADPLVLATCVVWTVGEMVISPPQMTFVSDIAPEALRGRYMAASAITWTVGSVLAGLVGARLMHLFGGQTMMLTMAGFALCSTLVYSRAAASARGRELPVAAPAAQ